MKSRLQIFGFLCLSALLGCGATSEVQSCFSPGVAGGPPCTPGAFSLGQDDLFSRVNLGAEFQLPSAVLVVGTKLVVADTSNRRVLIWNEAPTVNSVADVALGKGATPTSYGAYEASESGLGNPFGLASDGTALAVVDNAFHRVLIWNQFPTDDAAPADLVLGQDGFTDSSVDSGNGAAGSSGLNGPNAAVFSGTRLYVSDSGNNRILVWDDWTTAVNGQAADGVLGQPDFTTTTANALANKLSYPTGLHIADGKLFVADTGAGRVVVFNPLPSGIGPAASYGIGVSNLTSYGGGYPLGLTGFNEPSAITTAGGKLFVASKKDNRVTVYNSIPTSSGAAADFLLGQTYVDGGSPNAGEPLSDYGLNLPLSLSSDGNILWVADTQNHRVLKFDPVPTSLGEGAGFALGQANTHSGLANSRGVVNSKTIREPRGIKVADGKLFVADGVLNRILIYDPVPFSQNAEPSYVLGQANFEEGRPNRGSNRKSALGLNGPWDIAVCGGKLWVTDSQNRRVLSWRLNEIKNGAAASQYVGAPSFSGTYSSLSSQSLAFPTGLSCDENQLFVSDPAPSRILQYKPVPNENSPSASSVLGQPDFTSSSAVIGPSGAPFVTALALVDRVLWTSSLPGNRLTSFLPPFSIFQEANSLFGQTDFSTSSSGTSRLKLNTPLGMHWNGRRFYLADGLNHRILYWNRKPDGMNTPPDGVIGQPDFDSGSPLGGLNELSATTFLVPASITSYAGYLFIADSTNYRVVAIPEP